MIENSISLYYRRGNSDKVYNILFESNHGAHPYSVTAEYGRRGSVLRQQLKYLGSSRALAQGYYDAVLAEKTGKGYVVSIGVRHESIIPAVFIPLGFKASKKKTKTKRKPSKPEKPQQQERSITLGDL